MDLRTLIRLKTITGGGGTPETGYVHTDVKKITFNGNQYAWTGAMVANKANIIVLPAVDRVVNNVHIVSYDNILVFNGTASDATDAAMATYALDIPAGSYIAAYTPYVGTSCPSEGKNMHLDFFNDVEATSYTQRVTFDGVKNSAVTRSFTLSQAMKKLRVWSGVRAGTYNDYRIFITMFPSDVSITDLQEAVPADGTYTHTFGTTQSLVYTMQHTSTIYK